MTIHYGCQEFREDGERVIAGRAHPELVALFEAHRAHCLACDRHHGRLAAIYQPPRVPVGRRDADREFRRALAAADELRGREVGEEHWRRAGGAGVALLATAAVGLALTLTMPNLVDRLVTERQPAVHALVESNEHLDFGARVHIPERAAIEHRAQSFGRIVGGTAVLTDGAGRHANSDSFVVGTQIEAGDEAVQLGLLGRVLANLVPGSSVLWHSASPELVELTLERGTVAVRHDWRTDDPLVQIRTPTAIVRVAEAVVTVSVDERGATSVAVLRGEADVVAPGNQHVLATVVAGRRRDGSGLLALGRADVAAALPVSDEEAAESPRFGELLARRIPTTWTVPGLSDDPRRRTLEFMVDPARPSSVVASRARSRARAGAGEIPIVFQPPWAIKPDALDRAALADRERKTAVEGALDRCRLLYDDVDTRFRAARCLTEFMREQGHQPEAAEALLMFGVLRMDFANDYESAVRNFEEFLRRAPDHPKAELARYKLVLVAIETGAIEVALARSRVYLRRYPDGQYLGRILLRFPELKQEL